MKVVISGGSGLIGSAVARSLVRRADVVVLSRRPETVEIGRGVRWNPPERGAWAAEVETADVVINLAGASIAEGRWTQKRRRVLWDSRVDSTRAIVEVLGTRSSAERVVLVSASAIGFYGSRGDEELTETSAPGEGFLPELSRAWEQEAMNATGFARVVIPRIGIVLSSDGGALGAMLPIFRLGLGGRLGDGGQWMSWIHIEDVVAMIETAIDDERWEGAFNAVSPEPVTNRGFTSALGRALGRPTVLPAPGFAVRAMLGQMADALLLTGQKVLPEKAGNLGFEFRHATLEKALESLNLRA